MIDLDSARYVSLTTFKKDGSPKATPVWITGTGGSYLFTTGDKAWKTRRLLRNPAVEVQLCDMRGRLKPNTAIYKGTGEVQTGAESVAAAERALASKYGWQFKAAQVVDAVKLKFGRGPKQKVVAIHLVLNEN
jgi:PPOX class probable F420-dependent enzyme